LNGEDGHGRRDDTDDLPDLRERWRACSVLSRYSGLSPRFADGDRWIQLSDGKVSFAIAHPEEGAPGASGPVVVFTAGDVSALAEKGGKATGTRDMGAHGAINTFEDPQRNAFQLFQPARQV
jgi:hypothetical protein